MKIKICGMKYLENMHGISALNPDYMGFIFYRKSPRFYDAEKVDLPSDIQKVGVFVNEMISEIQNIIQKYNLDVVQFHGDESPEFCENFKNINPETEVWKAFQIDENSDFEVLKSYDSVDKFLFDTKDRNYGGNGIKFDWKMLENYQSEKKFILSGGISLDDISKIREVKYKVPQISTVDINSRFEIKPGWKDVEKVEKFYEQLKLIR